ncbi:ferritin-like domain-containing protein [Sphingobium sp. AR-3-1]|uniref:Ferritin-like domain-containing protein n=1 Tax=Sphingobium psychrophilum TaxID=2728834 RepID=A0A7X9ZRY3_9SPHN|nr:ferritin-like domain-containing protein [Sphingobium psychrophilum]NML08996.1 ferritin-like domain-containing protein [Sphingobium psychrophilum]
MPEWFRQRYLDLLGSIYIYNEHRGYTAIDRVLDAIRVRSPEDFALIAAVEKHRADERKHYLMFRRWFELRGTMPLFVDRACGHIDRFVEIMFRTGIDQLDTQKIIDSDDQFEKLCRVISLTEKRGFKQVEILLTHPLVRNDKVLMTILAIVHKDEPSHWAPYDGWLLHHRRGGSTRWERAIDGFIHSELLFVKLPLLFLSPFLRRRADWPDAVDRVEAGAAHFDLA